MSDEMGLFEVMYHCRSMRRLKPDTVPEELLVKLVEAGNQAASGSNLQMARWVVRCAQNWQNSTWPRG